MVCEDIHKLDDTGINSFPYPLYRQTEIPEFCGFKMGLPEGISVNLLISVSHSYRMTNSLKMMPAKAGHLWRFFGFWNQNEPLLEHLCF